jgi:RIO kinase 3
MPKEVAIKVFKTTLNEFHTRAKYVNGDYRFSKDEFKKQNPRKIIRIWAEKETVNLRR